MVGVVGNAKECIGVVFRAGEVVRGRRDWALAPEADQAVVLRDMIQLRESQRRVEVLRVMPCLSLAFAREPFESLGPWVMRDGGVALMCGHRRGG